jgi:V/A-type H+-transporting ATPase subunit A
MNKSFEIYQINGPVVKVRDAFDLAIGEKVYVGGKRLIGEVIANNDGNATVQVYEVTTGLKVGDNIIRTGQPLCVTLGPGILGNIFDGIQRPLKLLEKLSLPYIRTGSDVPPLDFEKEWDVKVTVKVGDTVSRGQIFATCMETRLLEHRFMSGVDGVVKNVKPSGMYRLTDSVAEVETAGGRTEELKLSQLWPIRKPRAVAKRLPIEMPMLCGQRVIDTLFPIARGGAAAIPGDFGTGKTMTQHQIAKWADADIIVYIGCGERGNEMTQVLEEFSELIDPRTKRALTEKTVLIANTSNMPVAAREASIYTGITIAEYYRDMGYNIAMMADSTSRWAEALREISGRLEEMPAEEGYPAYLPSRIAEFYERGGHVETLSGKDGSITIIGAVSPQGGDFSEPVTQNTKRFVRGFWALDKQLAYARHYPAINWMTSYSEYIEDLQPWYEAHVDPHFMENRRQIVAILNEEDNLMEIVKLIGADVLPDSQRLVMEIAKVIRVGFLQQNAMDEVDTYTSIGKQSKIIEIILYLYREAGRIIAKSIPVSVVIKTGIFEAVMQMKHHFSTSGDDNAVFEETKAKIDAALKKINEDYNFDYDNASGSVNSNVNAVSAVKR